MTDEPVWWDHPAGCECRTCRDGTTRPGPDPSPTDPAWAELGRSWIARLREQLAQKGRPS